jgi:hypothetical protein
VKTDLEGEDGAQIIFRKLTFIFEYAVEFAAVCRHEMATGGT